MLSYRYIILLLLLIASLVHLTSSTIHYVIPEDHYSTNNTSSSSHTLHYYLNNSKEYFTSHTQLHFLPGYHYLHSDLVIHNVTNISLTGEDSVIECRGGSAGIAVRNVTQFRIEYISLTDCSNNVYGYANDYGDDGKVMNTAALQIHSCRSVDIVSLSIIVNIGVDGLVSTNTYNMEYNKLVNITVQVNCMTQFNSSLTLPMV